MALSMWIEIMRVKEVSNGARRNPSTGTRMSLPAMVQVLSRAHLFTIFYKIFSLLYIIGKRVQLDLAFCYNEGRKIRQENKMSEPLFLQSVMQEKNLGWNQAT